jgi:D-amino peptidase
MPAFGAFSMRVPTRSLMCAMGMALAASSRRRWTSRAVYVRGRDPFRSRYTSLSQYDAVMFVGQHAMAGMAHAPLCHTGSSQSIVYYRMNNIYVGEFGFWTAIAGFQGAPVIFACGDDKLVEEAKALVPNISTVVTKWGEGWQKARHVPPEEVCAQIESTVSAACQRLTR